MMPVSIFNRLLRDGGEIAFRPPSKLYVRDGRDARKSLKIVAQAIENIPSGAAEILESMSEDRCPKQSAGFNQTIEGHDHATSKLVDVETAAFVVFPK